MTSSPLSLRCVTHLQLLDVDAGVVGEALRVGDLDVCFLQLAGQIIPHLEEEDRKRII